MQEDDDLSLFETRYATPDVASIPRIPQILAIFSGVLRPTRVARSKQDWQASTPSMYLVSFIHLALSSVVADPAADHKSVFLHIPKAGAISVPFPDATTYGCDATDFVCHLIAFRFYRFISTTMNTHAYSVDLAQNSSANRTSLGRSAPRSRNGW